MNRSTPGLPVHLQLKESTQIHVHWLWWCHPTISSSVVPFSSCPQSFLASGSFKMSQLFTSGGQSIGVSASTSVLPINTQDWSPLGWTGWMSLQAKGLSRVFSNTTVQKHQFFGTQLSLYSNSHIHTWPPEKPPSAVILEPPKNKVWHCFHCFPIYLPWSGGTRCHDLSFLNVEL